MREKALNYLGMMRKANAIDIGETDTGAAARASKAKLVLLASDASDNAVKRAEGFVYGRDIPLVVSPFTKSEISDTVGKNGCSMAAICDVGFANAFMKCLCSIAPGEYDEALKQIENELEKTKTPSHNRGAHEKNTRTGKRRKN